MIGKWSTNNAMVPKSYEDFLTLNLYCWQNSVCKGQLIKCGRSVDMGEVLRKSGPSNFTLLHKGQLIKCGRSDDVGEMLRKSVDVGKVLIFSGNIEDNWLIH